MNRPEGYPHNVCPCRQSNDSRWMMLCQIEGHIAMWAVRQSPYHNPDGLGEVLSSFRQLCRYRFDENEMGHINRETLKFILNILDEIPQFRDWNERKNGRQGPGFVSRYDKPNPDDDFIDLDALKMNVVHSLFKELEAEDKPHSSMSVTP